MKTFLGYVLYACVLVFTAAMYYEVYTQTPQQRPAPEQAKLADEPFKGITAKGALEPGLFRIKSTGVSTKPVRLAAEAFINGLSEEQRRSSRIRPTRGTSSDATRLCLPSYADVKQAAEGDRGGPHSEGPSRAG